MTTVKNIDAKTLQRIKGTKKQQKSYTKDFIRYLDILLDKGIFGEYKDIAKMLDIHPSTITNIRKQGRDVPFKYYDKLKREYGYVLDKEPTITKQIPFFKFSDRFGKPSDIVQLPNIVDASRFAAFEMDADEFYNEGDISVAKRYSPVEPLDNHCIVITSDFITGILRSVTDMNVIVEKDGRRLRIARELVKDIYIEKYRIVKS